MSTREQIEEMRRRLAQLEADLANEGAERHVYDAETGERVQAEDGSGNDDTTAETLQGIQNATSADEVMAALRNSGHPVAGEGDEVVRRELTADEERDYAQRIAQATTADEVLELTSEAYGFDPRVQR